MIYEQLHNPYVILSSFLHLLMFICTDTPSFKISHKKLFQLQYFVYSTSVERNKDFSVLKSAHFFYIIVRQECQATDQITVKQEESISRGS